MHPTSLLVAAALAAALVTGCGGDDDAATEITAPPATAQIGVVQPDAAVGAGLTVTTTDACEIVSSDDVAGAFGGDATDGAPDGSGGCSFNLSGDTVIGDLAGASTLVHVLISPDGYLGVDEQSAVLPDLEPITGIGDEAWYTAFNRELHVNLGGTDLIVIGASGDAAAGRDAVLSLGRTIVAGLEQAATED